jgi:hypothetical protein
MFENGRGEPLPCSLPQGDSKNPYSARSFSDKPLDVGGIERGSFSDCPKIWLLSQAVYRPILIVIAFKQIIVFAPLKSEFARYLKSF